MGRVGSDPAQDDVAEAGADADLDGGLVVQRRLVGRLESLRTVPWRASMSSQAATPRATPTSTRPNELSTETAPPRAVHRTSPAEAFAVTPRACSTRTLPVEVVRRRWPPPSPTDTSPTAALATTAPPASLATVTVPVEVRRSASPATCSTLMSPSAVRAVDPGDPVEADVAHRGVDDDGAELAGR